MVGELDGSDDLYDQAATYYEQVENHPGWNSEAEFHEPLLFLVNLIEYLDFPVDSAVLEAAMYPSLPARLELKRSTFSAVLEAVCDADHWDPE